MISGRIYVTESQIICGSRDGTANVLYPVSVGESIPSGIITMWSGASNAIPSGWWLCDGNNGTPDLRNRFIVGAGSSYGVGNTGGSDTVTLGSNQMPSHTHGFSLSANSNGNHSHSYSGTTSRYTSASGSGTIHGQGSATGVFTRTDTGYVQAGSNDYNIDTLWTMNVGGGESHSHTYSGSTSSGGAHTHSISGSISNTGGGQAHENRPPYYALCFIMKA